LLGNHPVLIDVRAISVNRLTTAKIQVVAAIDPDHV
jgi:hypothetical protein